MLNGHNPHRARDAIEVFRRSAGERPGGMREQRTHALAAAEHRVAHRLVQALRGDRGIGQYAGERSFGALLERFGIDQHLLEVFFVVHAALFAGEPVQLDYSNTGGSLGTFTAAIVRIKPIFAPLSGTTPESRGGRA